jgi:hypothetical protein
MPLVRIFLGAGRPPSAFEERAEAGIVESEATIQIQVVEWTGMGPPRFRVFIDGAYAGDMLDQAPESFPVTTGIHRVVLKRQLSRSETLFVTCSPGKCARLECGYYDRRRARGATMDGAQSGQFGLTIDDLASTLLVTLFANILMSPQLALALLIAVGPIALFLLVETVRTPGVNLYLRHRSAFGAAERPVPPVLRLRVTLRLLLFVVAMTTATVAVLRGGWLTL